jgi:3-oxoacyl-[acyl-carrier protein] reductase
VSETVLITGAGIGIGRATAKAFAKAGYRAIVTDILEKEGRAVAAEIADAGGAAEFHKLDVRSTTDADALVAAVEQKHGGIDVIVANAGIAHKTPLAALTDDK